MTVVIWLILGMQIPPNYGADYTTEFRDLFPSLAKANDAVLMPFLLEGVAARPELNLPDGIHPNVEGQKIVADAVWELLEPLIRELAGS